MTRAFADGLEEYARSQDLDVVTSKEGAYNRIAMATAAKRVYSHITKDPEVCGGRATIDGTRIRVLDIWSLKQRGLTPEQMLEEYPLTLAQVYAALSYAYENQAEIETAHKEDDQVAERIQRDREDFLNKSPAR